MLSKKCLARVLVLLIFFSVIDIWILVEAKDKPSIVVLLGPVASPEGVEMARATNAVFEKSGQFRTIAVRAGSAFSTFWEAAKFAKSINADYMVYMDISIRPSFYKYSTILGKPKESRAIEKYTARWAAEPRVTQEAMVSLASKVIYDSKGIITIHMTIESIPTSCDVYRDRYRLGRTDDKGYFRGTYWLKKGTYKIIVCKAEYKDWKDVLKVEKNPTRYTKKARLKRK